MTGTIKVSADSKAELRQLLDRLTIADDDSIELRVVPDMGDSPSTGGFDAASVAPPSGTKKAQVMLAMSGSEYRTSSEIADRCDLDVQDARAGVGGLNDDRADYDLAEKRPASDPDHRVEYRLNPLGVEVRRVLEDRMDE